ncbi:hypothetical protein DsansV1_C34g0225321 [Dioscorea sansibarensis]
MANGGHHWSLDCLCALSDVSLYLSASLTAERHQTFWARNAFPKLCVSRGSLSCVSVTIALCGSLSLKV